MERTQYDVDHTYRLEPKTFPISNNDRPATYDQFMSLRDTLVYSNKFYWNNAWRSLIIWIKANWNPTNTIEIWEPNIVNIAFEPDWTISWTGHWKYISTGEHLTENPLSCEINMTWRYVIQHKEQFNNIDSNITRIHTYVLQHHGNEVIQRAVYDYEWNTWWEILRDTAFGYLECDLQKWDRLELKIESQSGVDITSEIAPNSNRWIVEYKDLPYNI